RLEVQPGQGGRRDHGRRRADAQRPTGGALEGDQDRRRARALERRPGRAGDDSARSGRGNGRGRPGMSRALRRSIGTLGVAVTLSWGAGAALAQTSSDAETQYGPRDIGGTWERYPTLAGLGSGNNDAPPRPQPQPDPPLKP